MDDAVHFSELSGPAKGVLGFIGLACATVVVLLATFCYWRVRSALRTSPQTSGDKQIRQPNVKSKSKNKKGEKHVEEEEDEDADKETSPGIPMHATPGVSLKQLMKDSKAKAWKQGSSGEHRATHHPLFVITLKGHGDAVTGFAFSPDGKAIATVTDDRTLRLFRVTDISAKGIPFIKKGVTKDLAGVAFGSSAEDLAVLTKGSVGAAGLEGFRGGVALQSIWEQINVLGGRPALRLHSGRLPTGPALLLVSEPKTQLALYSFQGAQLASIDHGGILTHDAGISANGRFFAAATFTADVKVYEAAFDRSGNFSGAAKAMDLKGHKSQVLGVAFSDDATRMVTSSKDGTWAVWNIAVRYKQQEDPKRLLSRTQEVTMPHLYSRLAYGPDGIIAAVSGRDVHMLDSQTGSLLEVIEEPHAGSITEMAWAPVKYDLGGKGVSILGTSGTDNVVRLWRSPKV
eukprot:jgi/Botrbrau1/6864/Bobra.152_2s0022.1